MELRKRCLNPTVGCIQHGTFQGDNKAFQHVILQTIHVFREYKGACSGGDQVKWSFRRLRDC